MRHSVPFVAETDSLNSSILAPDAGPGSAEFDLFIREVVREITVKAGQKCTAIRKALVPAGFVDAAADALKAALGKIVLGDPRSAGVRMGPLVSLAQRADVLARVAELRRESDVIVGRTEGFEVQGADVRARRLRLALGCSCRGTRMRHERCTRSRPSGRWRRVVPYRDENDAIALARRGGGSLAASIFSADEALASRLVLGLAPYHGRILVVNAACAKESTGHGSPLAPLVHGGPGRAGGGEELGGIRGVLHYMQRTAVQGTPDVITALGGRWVRGSRQRDPGRHPFRIAFQRSPAGRHVPLRGA